MTDQKKIGILTRTGTVNFGTILQNYALQQAILELGFDAETIDDVFPRSAFAKGPAAKKKAGLKALLYNKYDAWRENRADKELLLRTKGCESFKKKQIKYYSLHDLDELNQRYRTVISGSDQIWAYAAEPEMFGFFMQSSVKNTAVKASYAVSVGSEYPDEAIPSVKRYLADMDFISVRESTASAILSRYTDKAITISCDPVFLLPADDWMAMAGRRKIDKPYIFCFFLTPQEWYFDKIRQAAAYCGDADIYVFTADSGYHQPYRRASVYSPKDFLNHIAYADYVVTDSYHAFLFSLIFERTALALKRFSDNDNNNLQNDRLGYITERLKITDRFIDVDKDPVGTPIDYQALKSCLHDFKAESQKYLDQILSYCKG